MSSKAFRMALWFLAGACALPVVLCAVNNAAAGFTAWMFGH
jgi:hypothetical protein